MSTSGTSAATTTAPTTKMATVQHQGDGAPRQQDRQQQPGHRHRDQRTLLRGGDSRARRTGRGRQPELLRLLRASPPTALAEPAALVTLGHLGPVSGGQGQDLVAKRLGIGQAQELQRNPRFRAARDLDRDLGEAEDPAHQGLHDVHGLQTVQASLPLLTKHHAFALLDRVIGEPEGVEIPTDVTKPDRDQRAHHGGDGQQQDRHMQFAASLAGRAAWLDRVEPIAHDTGKHCPPAQ